MITLTQIYNEILLKEQNKKMVENKNSKSSLKKGSGYSILKLYPLL